MRLGRLVPPRLLSVFDLLEEALAQVQDGSLDPPRATAMASLAGALIKTLTAGEVEQRVRQLEGRFREDTSP